MQELLAIIQQLRQSCEWNKQQTSQSLTKYAIEEAYEVEAAVQTGDLQHIKEELGDLLWQIIFQAQIYQEQQYFDFNDIVDALKEKLIRRHPHAFQSNTSQPLDHQQRHQTWQEIKRQEQSSTSAPLSLLTSVKHAPAIVEAQQLQTIAATIGFDFPDLAQTYAKLDEELAELQHAITQQNQQEIIKEFGDSLFALINIGRKLGISSEEALYCTISKFRNRFSYIEQQAQQQGKTIDIMSLEEMDQLWEQAKNDEK